MNWEPQESGDVILYYNQDTNQLQKGKIQDVKMGGYILYSPRIFVSFSHVKGSVNMAIDYHHELKCLNLAIRAHTGHLDRAKKPYIEHCLRVRDNFPLDDYFLRSVALLHDVIEDSSYTRARLLDEGIDYDVVSVVELLTRIRGQHYGNYICGISSCEDATRVKLADLKDNLDLLRLPEVTVTDLDRARKYHHCYRYLEKSLDGGFPDKKYFLKSLEM